MPPLLDSHHHLDFQAPGSRGPFLRAVAERDVRVVAQTLLPSAFDDLVRWTGQLDDQTPGPLLSLGFHPWRAAGPDVVERELRGFATAVTQTRFIGEIGLDHSPRRVAEVPAELQRHVLRELLQHVAGAASQRLDHEPYVLSIHAVRSAGEVLDLLDEVQAPPGRIVPVFHRFSGTSDELTRLVRAGGCISIHPQMLTTRRGRAYARQVPDDRLLLESDLPPGPLGASGDEEGTGRTQAKELAATLRQALDALSELRGQDMSGVITETQRRLHGVE